jgi:hypothetical protein
MKNILLFVVLFLSLLMVASCDILPDLPINLTEGEEEEMEPTSSKNLVTKEQELQQGDDEGPSYVDFDCISGGPFTLEATHNYSTVVDEATYNFQVSATIDLVVDSSGRVTGSGGGSEWQVMLEAPECLGTAYPAYSAEVSGTCENSLMLLNISETVGAHTMTFLCGEDPEPYSRGMPGATMTHENIPIRASTDSRVNGAEVYFMAPQGEGVKKWVIFREGDFPLVPLTTP